MKEVTEQKSTSDSVSQRSEDYSLNLAEAVRVRISGKYTVVCVVILYAVLFGTRFAAPSSGLIAMLCA